MRSRCTLCLFLPGFDSFMVVHHKWRWAPRHIRLSVKHWEVCRRHLLCCSPRPPRPRANKVPVPVKLFDPVRPPTCRKLKIRHGCAITRPPFQLSLPSPSDRCQTGNSNAQSATEWFNMRSCAGANSKRNRAIVHCLVIVISILNWLHFRGAGHSGFTARCYSWFEICSVYLWEYFVFYS